MASRERPLSPHLQVYRWQIQMVTSIMHRVTGVILTVGSLLVVWALMALAAGPEHWADFTACARSPLGFLVLFGWSWALAFHLINGVKHLLQDFGMAYRVETFIRNGWIAVIGSLALTALIWIAAIMREGGA